MNSQHTSSPSYSFDKLYAMYRDSVFNYLKRRCASFHDAEDLTQQVFEYILKRLDSYDPEKASIKNWIFMICVSRWKNYCRDRKLFCDIDAISEFVENGKDDLEKSIWIGEIRNAIANAIDALPLTQKQIIVFRYFRNVPYAQIAQRLGISETSARVSCHRALEKLRNTIKIQECAL